MAKKSEEVFEEQIIKTEYSDTMQKSFINYAMSVIIARALPDVRDGFLTGRGHIQKNYLRGGGPEFQKDPFLRLRGNPYRPEVACAFKHEHYAFRKNAVSHAYSYFFQFFRPPFTEFLKGILTVLCSF